MVKTHNVKAERNLQMQKLNSRKVATYLSVRIMIGEMVYFNREISKKFNKRTIYKLYTKE